MQINVILEQIFLVFTFWVVVYYSNLNDDEKSESTEQMHLNEQIKVLICIASSLSAFLLMLLLAKYVTRRERPYEICLNIFVVFVFCCQLVVFLAVIRSVKLEYGPEFRRKIFLIDDQATGKAHVTYDDGTFFIASDGSLQGRVELDEAPRYYPVRGHIEGKANYYCRFFFLLMILLGLTMILMSLLVLSLFYMVKVITKVHCTYRDRVTVHSTLRNGMIMNFMTHFPYSQFMLSEARDCPICFEPFSVQDQVVQLKCNRYHVFHYNCMERYLRYFDENEPLA